MRKIKNACSGESWFKSNGQTRGTLESWGQAGDELVDPILWKLLVTAPRDDEAGGEGGEEDGQEEGGDAVCGGGGGDCVCAKCL